MNKLISESRILFLDSGVIVRLLQMNPDSYSVVSSVLDYAYEKNITLLTSVVTLFEISQKAYAVGDSILARQYREFFEHSQNVRMCGVDGDVALKAAELSKNNNLSESDAIRLATAYCNGADCIFTENSSWKDVTDIPVVLLDEV
ncbi:MAG: PIN domain-containing protein [Fibrobacter sp.]|nr:PIN domain-containing protein [Fibrobacter sp.]